MPAPVSNQEKCELARRCWYLTGATASGKTSVSLEMAKRLNAEIISLDSMAIYRGMDIGTAKPSPQQREQVKHHLIDIRDPIQSFSVSEYRELAHTSIAGIRERGREVLFVGGTALYLKALLRGIFDGPPADPDFRKQIESELADVEVHLLHERLMTVDPVAAHRLHPNDRRRIIRALEVYKQTGQPISHWQMEFDDGVDAEQCRVFSLRRPRNELHVRIENRVRHMFSEGLVDEVKKLLDRWKELGRTASQAVGYREVIALLGGELDLAAAIDKVLVRTRGFARHQETWFRGLRECRMIDLEPGDNAHDIAQRLVDVGRQANGASEK